jgi:hypothetical protein
VQDLDIIYVDTPSGKIIEICSSSNLFVFCSGADPQCAEGLEAASMGSSSVSIRELWPDIDKLDEVSHGGASTVAIPEVAPRAAKSQASVEKTDKCAKRKSEKALLKDAPGPSIALPKSRGSGSTKRKAV